MGRYQVRVGAVLPFWLDREPTEALDIARAAEDAGCDELWVGEMVTFDAFALGGALARDTSRITLVCGPVPLGVRSPAALALGIASVSWLGDRPAHLALGASTPAVVAGFHGVPWRHHVGRADETVRAMRSLLAGERAAFRGEHVTCEGFRLRRPLPASEIRLAAFGPRMAALAGRVADRVVVNLLTPDACAAIGRTVRDAASSAGRTPPPLVAWVPAAINPGEPTKAQLRRQLAVYLPQPGYGELFARAGFAELVDASRTSLRGRQLADAIPDDLLAAVCAMGDEATVASRLGEYREAGVDLVAVVPATAEDPGGDKTLRSVVRLCRELPG